MNRVLGAMYWAAVAARAIISLLLCANSRAQDGLPAVALPNLEMLDCAAPGVPIALAEPGPQNRGLRLRLDVFPVASAKAGYVVKVKLLNVGNHDVTIEANWRTLGDQDDVKEYLEAATGIETYPPIAPWIGGVRVANNSGPQPRLVLRPGETVPLEWQTAGRHLKNRVTDPSEVQNPEFVLPGVYAVHALLAVKIVGEAGKTILLRSNEVLVMAGGSPEVPKHSYGEFWGGESATKSGTLGLGELQKVEVGDEFLVGYAKAGQWRMRITEVRPTYSLGLLAEVNEGGQQEHRKLPFPERGAPAVLVTP